MAEQSFANHTKVVPLFHYFVMPVLTINFGWSIYQWKVAAFSLNGLITALAAAALIILMFCARIFALTVQDRVIRLEEHLRYQHLLPADLQPSIGEIALAQLVSLRFAGDAELPALVRKVQDEKLTDRKTIKQLIKNWKPDHLRA